MKKLLFTIAIIWGASGPFVRAQSPGRLTTFGSVQSSVMSVNVGPMALAGVALSTGSITPGMKTTPGLAYAPGALIDFTYSRTVGFELGMAYDSRTTTFHNVADPGSVIDYTFGFITLRPELRVDGFLVGVGLGLPVTVSTTVRSGASVPAVRLADVNPLFEGRVGGMVELTSNRVGTLDLLVEGSYAFSRNLTDAWFHGTDETRNNGPIATVELGVCYLFNFYRAISAPGSTVAISSQE